MLHTKLSMKHYLINNQSYYGVYSVESFLKKANIFSGNYAFVYIIMRNANGQQTDSTKAEDNNE